MPWPAARRRRARGTWPAGRAAGPSWTRTGRTARPSRRRGRSPRTRGGPRSRRRRGAASTPRRWSRPRPRCGRVGGAGPVPGVDAGGGQVAGVPTDLHRPALAGDDGGVVAVEGPEALGRGQGPPDRLDRGADLGVLLDPVAGGGFARHTSSSSTSRGSGFVGSSGGRG